jgi:hypothetical protein
MPLDAPVIMTTLSVNILIPRALRDSGPWQNCGTGVSPVVFTTRNSVSELLLSLLPRADRTRRSPSLPGGVLADRVPLLMDADQTLSGERPGRPAVLSGAVVVLAALIGAGCAMAVPGRVHAGDKGGVVAAWCAPVCHAGLRVHVSTLVWTASALVVLLLLGRRVPVLTVCRPVADVAMASDGSRPAMLLRRRLSISYHSGGLYGP